MNTVFLAFAHLRFHPWRSLALTLAVALILAAPLTVERLVAAAQTQMGARAEATPLLLGARGSRLDLAMSALHFTDDLPQPLDMAAADAIWDSGLAAALPLHLRFRAEGAPVVGVTLDYFDFRGLEVAQGRGLATLGEAVLGAAVARRLGLGPGDAITTTPGNLFDLGGSYPLRTRIAGVLAPTGSDDDRAVFVDIKTAWAIAGIGHGHDDVVASASAGEDGVVVADAEIARHVEITPETLDSFHFHGDPAAFPVDAVIVLPHDARAATILRGRYLDRDAGAQLIEPAAVMAGLFDRVVRIKRAFDAVVAAAGGAAALAVGLAILLSTQLRAAEMETAFRLGAPRGTIARLIAAESVIILSFALVITSVTVHLTGRVAGTVMIAIMTG